jgi:ligand-binding sensor protein
MQIEIEVFFINAVSQKLSDALNIIILACTVELLEISKVLHGSRYSYETNAATKSSRKCSMPGAIERAKHHNSILYR